MPIYLTTLSAYSPQETPSDTQRFFDEIYGMQTRYTAPKTDHTPQFFRTYTRKLTDSSSYKWGIKAPMRGENTWERERRKSEEFMCRNPDLNALYDVFHIPKKTGGYRTICAPKEILKERQREIKDWIQNTVKALPHDCAFAYVQHRTGRDALIRHQRNESRWFLKIDLKNFFPSLSPEFVLNQLMKNGAITRHDPEGYMYIHQHKMSGWNAILKPCFLDNGLPQGAITSPLLSNLAMLPIDFELSGELFNYEKHRYIYTRYADDILISCKEKFDPKKIIAVVERHLQGTPLRINAEKTRFGSSAGSNWNLGIMYNDKCDLTVGHKRKARFRSALFAFLQDHRNGRPWAQEDTRHLDGERAWFASIEPTWTNTIVEKYEQEYAAAGYTFRRIVKEILNP